MSINDLLVVGYTVYQTMVKGQEKNCFTLHNLKVDNLRPNTQDFWRAGTKLSA